MQINLSFDEIERHAYISDDRAVLALIDRAEESAAAEMIYPTDHEAMVDDRNGLRDALQACVDAMTEADTALTLCDDDEAKAFTLPPSHADALSDAEDALKVQAPQIDDTKLERLAKADRTIAELRERMAADAQKLRAADEVLRCLQYLVSDYVPTRYGSRKVKPAPKWAQHAIATLERVGASR